MFSEKGDVQRNDTIKCQVSILVDENEENDCGGQTIRCVANY